ncbi:unnamed protein product, partial [Rotaria sp. Silwood2]
KAYPDDLFVVHRWTAPGGAWKGYETKLSEVQCDDEDWLRVIKLQKSKGLFMKEDEIRSKAFSFIYNTKGESNCEKRRDSLFTSLNNIFPNYNVSVFIFEDYWAKRCWCKGWCEFRNEYGSDVSIIFS